MKMNRHAGDIQKMSQGATDDLAVGPHHLPGREAAADARTGSMGLVALCNRGLLLLVLLLTFAGCSQKAKPVELPSIANYPEFLKVSSDALCKKMLTCYEKMYRTLSPELKVQVNVQSCVDSALSNLDEKLAVHTDEMKLFSKLCYQAAIETPCDQFAAVAAFYPACTKLRDLSAVAYEQARERRAATKSSGNGR